MGPFGDAVQFNGTDGESETDSAASADNRRQIRLTARDPWFYVAILLALLLVALLVFVVMTIRSTNAQLRTYRREIQAQQLQSTLASALIDADRAEYEQARQSAGDFYSALEREFASDDPLLSPQQREAMVSLLARKQAVLQMLANKDPQSVGELSAAYDSCRRAIKSFQPLIE